ncbi:hypothetical protein CgunFtcFv8_007206 [Champsocephalus gunnari]|uniref:Uncharacterized protein n=1 Tax=Champsocephalus gunnari TaxID=52237 RepID=A0AAN8H5G7_CHAGU|nr:hypothetical protein CgunFtcFv8_007206 [Champsocephalus gunnari]
MGGPVARLLKFSRKDTRHLPFLTSVNHTGPGGREGGAVSCPWSDPCLTYLLNIADLNGRPQLRRGGRRF